MKDMIIWQENVLIDSDHGDGNWIEGIKSKHIYYEKKDRLHGLKWRKIEQKQEFL